MKIQRCHICDKPFFPNPSTTDFAQCFDPTACPQCNANASKNSHGIIDHKTYDKGMTMQEEEMIGKDTEEKFYKKAFG